MRANFTQKTKSGWITLITGCMFAGKTEEFIRVIKRYQHAKYNILAFKPEIDNRYDSQKINSHSGMKLDSIVVKNSKELFQIVKERQKVESVEIIGIDELQFFDNEIVKILMDFADSGIIVIANGLDKDFKADPFQNVYELLAQAEYVIKLQAICFECGGDANRTQRIINGNPAKKSDPIILVDGAEKYEARCRHCYILPD